MKPLNAVTWRTVFSHAGGAGKVLYDRSRPANESVYHRLPWQFALPIFKNGCLRLGAVQRWTDPYEKWWCDGLFGRSTDLQGVNAYALCWTTSSFDEPAWRMFSSGAAPIVRIECRRSSLLDAAKNFAEDRSGSWFLGAVRYCPEKILMSMARQVNQGLHKEVSRTAASMLLHKRNHFQFEQEIRLLYLERGTPRDEVFLPIETQLVIEDVMTSPYATPDQHQQVVSDLKKFNMVPRRSLILSPPKWPADA